MGFGRREAGAGGFCNVSVMGSKKGGEKRGQTSVGVSQSSSSQALGTLLAAIRIER